MAKESFLTAIFASRAEVRFAMVTRTLRRSLARPWVMACGALLLCIAVAPRSAFAGWANETTFTKAKYSSVKQPNEANVDLTVDDSKIVIKGKGKKAKGIDLEIPYGAIDAMSYEMASRHRVGEGAALMTVSLGAGAILMATKTKSHWLSIDHHDGEVKQETILRLDKSEYESVISALESKSGKHVTVLDAKTGSLNPTAGSQNVDEVLAYSTENITVALKAAMQSQGCEVTKVTDSRIQCKRARGYSELRGAGGEKVTARLESQGGSTHVRISTAKGRKNWSTPIYQEMIKGLKKPA